jgi:hypothetical protein
MDAAADEPGGDPWFDAKLASISDASEMAGFAEQLSRQKPTLEQMQAVARRRAELQRKSVRAR